MNSLARMGLGTAQFGTRYGISNDVGQPDEAEVAAILSRAAEAGFGYLDTAAGYGDAEVLIGRHLPQGHDMRIVTKTLPFEDASFTKQHQRLLIDTVATSCERLRVDRLYGVLLHRASDLAKPGAEYLIAALRDLQSCGWVKRIGVSVYDANELAMIERHFRPELVQLPFNVLDQRLVKSRWLDRLQEMGAEVHARSVFLQGLLLMDAERVPSFFAPILPNLAAIHAQWTSNGRPPLAGCVAAVFSCPQISAAVVGANRLCELEQLIEEVENIGEGDVVLAENEMIDEIYLDPRKWPAVVN